MSLTPWTREKATAHDKGKRHVSMRMRAAWRVPCIVKTNLSEQNTNDGGSAVCTCEIRGSSECITEPEPDTSVCREHN